MCALECAFSSVLVSFPKLLCYMYTRSVRAKRAHSFVGCCMRNACCYNLEMVVQWISVYLNFLPLRMLAQYLTFSWERVDRIFASGNQPEQKLVSLLAATWETVSFQQRSVSPSSPKAKVTGAIFPPRSDLVANYRPSNVSVSLDLTLAPRVHRTTSRTCWQCGGRRSL